MPFGSSGKYAKVTTSDASAFTIDDDDDDGEKLSMDDLRQMHESLVAEAQSAINDTSGAVNLLNEQRLQSGVRIAGIGPAGSSEVTRPKRYACCPAACGAVRCVIL